MVLELNEIEKAREGFRLWPINLSIPAGEFFCLLGPSGCGKTTLLRIIGGFETPTAGTVSLGGRNITSDPPHRRPVHTVFQRYSLFPHLNVFENVAFSLRIGGRPSAEVQKRVTDMLELVEIPDLQGRRIQELSGGQAQRVALARALVGRPAVLLLDEPLSALDPALRLRMREELRNLCRKVGSTFVMVTHDQEEALQIADRLAVLRDGRCLQVGPPKDVYEFPADPFVARFIGPANEIESEISGDQDGHWALSNALGNFRIRKNGVTFPSRVTLILRPEKIRILRQRSHAQENLVEAQIQEMSYLGSRTEYVVMAGGRSFRVFEPELERQKKRGLICGDRVYLSWRSEDAIILPGETTT